MSPVKASDSADIKHFKSIPWCAKHLDQPGVIITTPLSRRRETGEDNFFSTVLNSENTVPAFILFYKSPDSSDSTVDELNALLTLNSGLSGYPGVCHGGMVASILDVVTGLVIPIHGKRNATLKIPHMTGYLTTKYERPVLLPSTVLAKAWIVKVEGRKVYVNGSIEDEHGNILTRAEALYVALKAKV